MRKKLTIKGLQRSKRSQKGRIKGVNYPGGLMRA